MKQDRWKVLARATLLSGLLGLILAGCSKSPPTSAELRAAWMEKTHRAITDPARAEQIAAMVSRILDAQEARAAALRSASERLAALNADYHVTNEQLMAIYHEYEARQREALTTFKTDVFALRQQLTAAEWEALVD